jgi:hypothetical protein
MCGGGSVMIVRILMHILIGVGEYVFSLCSGLIVIKILVMRKSL